MTMTATLDDLKRELSRTQGFTERFSEKFIVEFFKVLEEGLRDSRRVTIKGLGIFSADDDGSVNFIPDEALAARINEPFECFSPIVLSEEEVAMMRPDETDKELAEAEEISDTDTANEADEAAEAAEDLPEIDRIETEIEESDDVEETVRESIDSTSTVETQENHASDEEKIEEEPIVPEEYSDIEPERPKPRRGLFFALGLLLGIIIGIIAGYMIPTIKSSDSSPDSSSDTVTEPVQTEETAEITAVETLVEPDNEDDTVPQQPVVTETVSSTNYLASMARRHYGRFEFWVYIYEENRDKLNHPDFIEPNTVVVIPPADKYGIDPNDPESVRLAESKAKEIYSRFK